MRDFFLCFSPGSSHASAHSQDDPAKIIFGKEVSKKGEKKKVTNLEGHIAVEGPCRLDAERAG